MVKYMSKIDTTQIKSWNIASKTRPIKAKPLINLLVDRTVTIREKELPKNYGQPNNPKSD